jgi:ABC-type nitrate/sulfonate/bicarbonate transport system permease component
MSDLPDHCFGYVLHLVHTIRNILIAVALGTLIGLGVGLSTLLLPWIADVVTPVAGFFGTVPIFIVAPFFVIWFGIGYPLLTTIGVVAFYTTLLMYFFCRRAAENIPVGIIESALTLGGDRRTIFRWVYLRGTIPEIAGGLRIALGGAWGLGTLVEVLGPQMGGGFLIRMWSHVMSRPEGPAAVVSLILFFGVLAVIVDAILVLVIRLFTRWTEGGRQLGL